MKQGRLYVASALALSLYSLGGCAAEDTAGSTPRREIGPNEDWGDSKKYPELGGAYHSLEALVGTCTFVNGVVTVTMTAAQTVIIGTRAVDSAILINDATCNSDATSTVPATPATTRTLKRLVVAGSSGNDVVILDFLGGTFAKGVVSATAGGISVDLGSGTNELRIRGTTGNDEFYMGSDGISFDKDNYKDITFAGVNAVAIAMADGNDVFVGSNASPTPTRGVTGNTAVTLRINGGEGNDTITGGAALDNLVGGPGADTINGGSDTQADTLFGDAGKDVMFQGATADGNDVLDCGDDGDVVSYAARTVQVIATVGGTGGTGSEADVINVNCEGLIGGSGHDKLVGDAGNNTLSGGPGNDALIGLGGDDILNGDDGNDTFVESYLAAGVAVDDTMHGAITYTPGTMEVNVNDADNGADTFNGGAGTDLVDYSARTGVLTITMDGRAADDGISGEEDNVKADVENVVGGSGNDEITGNALGNRITGGAGDDTLDGAGGDDTFYEGTEDSGSDTFIGGAGIDLIDYSGRILTDGTDDLVITMGDETANDGAMGEGDNIGLDIENVTGGAGADNITGNDLANIIDGKGGVDVLFGMGGNDRVDGGDSGNNTLDCGAGTDIGLNYGATAPLNCEV